MPKQPSVLEVCVSRLGVHRGALAAAAVAQMALATHELGHVPSGTEYAEFWSINVRTAWRHRKRVSNALGESWPEVVAALSRRLGDRSSQAAVMSMPAPAGA